MRNRRKKLNKWFNNNNFILLANEILIMQKDEKFLFIRYKYKQYNNTINKKFVYMRLYNQENF